VLLRISSAFFLCYFLLGCFLFGWHFLNHLLSGVNDEKNIFSITKYKRIFFNVKKIIHGNENNFSSCKIFFRNLM